MAERLIRLGLHAQDGPFDDLPDGNYALDLASFCGRLMTVISATAVESKTLHTEAFRAKLEQYRTRLENAPDGDPEIARVAGECLRVCERYLNRARDYLLERENEFVDVINVMRS